MKIMAKKSFILEKFDCNYKFTKATQNRVIQIIFQFLTEIPLKNLNFAKS